MVDFFDMHKHIGLQSCDSCRFRFTCSQCAAQFYTKGELDQHEGYHVEPNKRPWVCNVCGKSFTREFALKVSKRHCRTRSHATSSCIAYPYSVSVISKCAHKKS